MGDDCDPYCLFDIVNDPRELNNLAKTQPKLMQELLQCYNKYSQEPYDTQDQGYHSNEDLPSDMSGNLEEVSEEIVTIFYLFLKDIYTKSR